MVYIQKSIQKRETEDVMSTQTVPTERKGSKRLRVVIKYCRRHGQRLVKENVFLCEVPVHVQHCPQCDRDLDDRQITGKVPGRPVCTIHGCKTRTRKTACRCKLTLVLKS